MKTYGLKIFLCFDCNGASFRLLSLDLEQVCDNERGTFQVNEDLFREGFISKQTSSHRDLCITQTKLCSSLKVLSPSQFLS